jgi:hypothetical protein
MIITRVAFLFIFIAALAYAALRVWQHRKAASDTDDGSGFRPSVGFSRMDGMESLSLLLANESWTHVWVEEIEIFLSGLVAENQTSEPTLRGIQKIRQMIRARDTLPISLAGAIYKAAGEPQRKHSSVLSSVLRYRIGEEWLEKNLDNYRIQMIGLTASGVQIEREPVPQFQSHEKPEPAEVMTTKPK